MQLKTRHFGDVEIDENSIINFPEGLPGFEQVKKFVLLGSGEEELPFKWLQGVDDGDLAFVVVDPRLLMQEYVVDIDDSEIEVLDVKEPEKVAVYSIVVVPDDVTQMTANLKAPVLINVEEKKGKQVVLNNSEYPIKYHIINELLKTGGNK